MAEGTKGVVAAGHQASAQAGADVLAAGGNAVDAAIATAFAACVAEPFLTALGAGGFMLVHDHKSGQDVLLDFFVAMPGEGLDSSRRLGRLVPAPLDFGGATQLFHAGHASVGVPGLVAGLFEAHDRFATMPMSDLIQPAQALAREGVTVNTQAAFFFKLLANILKLSEESRQVFFDDAGYLTEGETFYHRNLTGTLAALATEGPDLFYQGDIAAALVTEMERGGGYITRQDLAKYRVIERSPVEVTYRQAVLKSNPPPSSGGALVAHSLRLLGDFDVASMPWQSTPHLHHLAATMRATNEVRKARFDDNLREEDVLDRLLGEAAISGDRSGLADRLGNTTHLSVIDAAGNAVSMTSSNGANSGIGIAGTGILLNNILGEEDLNPQGFHQHPAGQRLTSMMAPTLVLERGEVRLALGSAGSNRIRSAVLQTVSNVFDFQLPVAEAIAAPRIHFEGGALEVEAGIPEKTIKDLAASGWKLNVWPDSNAFFGGVQAAARETDGVLSGAGDPRRGGTAVVV